MRFNEFMASTNTEYDPLIKLLSSLGLSTNSKAQTSRLDKIRHVRVTDPIAKIEQAIKKVQNVQIKKVGAPNQLSSKYEYLEVSFPEQLSDIYPDLAGKEFNVVSAIGSGRTVAIKAFTPVNLGLAGKTFTKPQLYSTLKQNVESNVNDETLKNLLLELIEVAVGNITAVAPEIIEAFTTDDLKQLGIDFGEILGPLLGSDDTDAIVFPSGNAMLADVEINGKPISIKSGAGSGTSFKAIRSHLDKFSNSPGHDDLDVEEKEVYRFYRAFIDTPGTNHDKLIAGSLVAQTDEHKALVGVLGKDNFTQTDLETFAEKYGEGKAGYIKFLKAIYPIADAGPYTRPNGLPQDSSYYLGTTDKIPKAKQAGLPFWNARGPAEAGRNIILYILATSFLKAVKDVNIAQKHNNLLSKIMKDIGAEVMLVDINSNGTIELKRNDISNAKISFQYHAPSHIPGNNAPGFSLKLD
tara:strand:- start:877 stop:2274 length:1398 start_codon:yes stop_codon:yes gene_type:complete